MGHESHGVLMTWGERGPDPTKLMTETDLEALRNELVVSGAIDETVIRDTISTMEVTYGRNIGPVHTLTRCSPFCGASQSTTL